MFSLKLLNSARQIARSSSRSHSFAINLQNGSSSSEVAVSRLTHSSGFTSFRPESVVKNPLKWSSALSRNRLRSANNAAAAFKSPIWMSLGSRLSSLGFRRFRSPGAYSGWSRNSQNSQAALYSLMAANGLVFLLWRADVGLALRHFTTSWDAVKAGRWHTLVTAAFSQRDTMHLASNMLGLFFFGRAVSYTLGSRGLILLYLAGGVFGNIVYVAGQAWQSRGARDNYWDRSFFYQPNTGTPALGASGAVNSIVIFDCCIAPMSTVLIYGILPMPAFALGALYLWFDIQGALGHGKNNVGYTTHLGGALIGGLTYLGVRRGRIPTQWRRW